MTYWNGQPTPARRVVVQVGPPPSVRHWSRYHVGELRSAVEIVYCGHRFYIDDQYGQGWEKVTEGYGSPRYGHRNLYAEHVFDECSSQPRFQRDLAGLALA